MKKTILLLAILCLIFSELISKENLEVFSFDGRKDFLGGFNNKLSPNLLRKDQSSQLDNFSTDDKSGLVKRDGFKYISKLPVGNTVKIIGVYTYNKDDGTTHFIVQAGSQIFSSSDAGENWTLRKTDVSSNNAYRWATHYNYAWGVNGINNTINFDGTTMTEYSFVPKGQFIKSGNGRLWIGATYDEQSTVYFSEINVNPINESDWDITNSISQGLGDGQIIKGLDFQKGIIWYYKDNSFYGIYDIKNVRLLSSNYGTMSQDSISDYYNGKIFLDKKGLFYFAGGNVQYLSNDVENEINKIGLINNNSNRWSTTSLADFSQGTFENCWNNNGSVEMSTGSVSWGGWSNGVTGTAQIMCQNDGVVSIATTTGSGWNKLSLRNEVAEQSYGMDNRFQFQGFGQIPFIVANPHNQEGLNIGGYQTYNGHNDNDINSYAAAYINVPGVNAWFSLSSTDTVFAMPIKKIRVRYQHAYRIRSVTDPNLNNYIAETFIPVESINNAFIELMDADHSNKVSGGNLALPVYPYSTILTKDIEFSQTYNRQRINLYVNQNRPANFITNDAWGVPRIHTPAILIYDISVYGYTTPAYYSTGTWISPPFPHSHYPSWMYFYPIDNLSNGISSGTITYKLRAADDLTMTTNVTNWYSLETSSKINTALDGHRFIQIEAIINSSSVTFSPTAYGGSLIYHNWGANTTDTLISTYTSKSFNAGSQLASWGSFIASYEGTVSFQISSNTINWINIISGDDISISSNSTTIYWRGIMTSKYANIKSVNITYNKGTGINGGSQDTPSININDRYLLGYSTWASWNTDVLIFNKNKVFERWTEYPVSGFCKYGSKWYFTSSTQPILYEMFSGDTATDAVWKSLHTDFGISNRDKQIRYAYITTEPKIGSFCFLEYSMDFSTFTTKVFVDLSGTTRNKRVEFADGYIGKNFYFTLSSTSTAKPEIQKFDIYYNDIYKLRSEP